MKLKNYALKALTIVMIALTSCDPSFSRKENTLNIYQPTILSLEKGKTIPTKDGMYTPQLNEVWHSDARYRKLERDLLY